MSREDKYLHHEEHYFSKERKTSRKERKLASDKDRSQFKKSDQDQLKKQEEGGVEVSHMQCGRVLAITPDGISVNSDGALFTCTLKGTLKKNIKRMKNIIAVGDIVWFEDKGGLSGTIAKIAERTSVLSRADNLSRTKEQLIAVNIDQVIITCSVVAPPLKLPLLDRYIIAAKKGNMEPIIVINKIDLFTTPPLGTNPQDVEEEKQLFDEVLHIYRSLHLKVIPVSVVTNEGIEELKNAMKNKTSVFSGQSGVGKSQLISLITGHALPTGTIVKKTLKGSHTTTTTSLIALDKKSFCIDTPGIKSFGLWDLKTDEIREYFSEIHDLSGHCKFPDCQHINEPHCAVKEAVEHNRISPLRFASYCALMASLTQEHGRR